MGGLAKFNGTAIIFGGQQDHLGCTERLDFETETWSVVSTDPVIEELARMSVVTFKECVTKISDYMATSITT